MEFNPFNQTITLKDRSGSTIDIPVAAVDSFYFYNIKQTIILAAQFGASLLFAAVTIFLTRPERRKTPIFVLNLLSLGLNSVRCLLISLYYLSAFSSFYAFFANDYSRVPRSDYATSVAAEVIGVMLQTSVLSCVAFQVVTICKTFAERWRMVFIALSVLLASSSVVVRAVLCVYNSKAILQAAYFSDGVSWIRVNNIITTTTICLFSTLFTAKLVFSIIKRRKYLHMKKFGNLEALAIGASQCMFFPAIFSILEYNLPFPGSSSLVLTFVAISLPLSSLWASAVTTSRTEYEASTQRILNGSTLITKDTKRSSEMNISGIAKRLQQNIKRNKARSNESISTREEESADLSTEINVTREISYETNDNKFQYV